MPARRPRWWWWRRCWTRAGASRSRPRPSWIDEGSRLCPPPAGGRQARYTVFPRNQTRPSLPRFYITTAIDYVNGRPHLGHAYEKVLGDAIARFHRQRGDQTFYLTGTDEHGQNIARAAAAAGKPPRQFVDENAAHFKTAWKALNVGYDRFIRTTDQRHELAVQELFRRLHDASSPKTGSSVLFEEDYEGLYCESCEEFKQEKDLDEQGRCPLHKTTPKKVRETNFFFRLSEYDDALLRHIQAHPEFIEPDYRRN